MGQNCNDSAQYINGNGSGYLDSGLVLSANLVETGKYNVFGKADNADLNSTYYIRIIPTGQYYTTENNGQIILSYKRGNMDLRKSLGSLITVKDVPDEQQVNIGGTSAKLLISIKGIELTENMYGASTVKASDNKIYLTNTTGAKQYVEYDGENILELKYSNNKKAGTGKVTLKATKAGAGYFKGSVSVNFTIKAREVTEAGVYDAKSVSAGNAGKVFVDAADVVAPKSGEPKVSAAVYQINETGDKAIKLGKKDYTIAAGKKDAAKGYPIEITNGNSGNFKFAESKASSKVISDAYFNVYGKKAKVKATLSQGNAVGCSYDAVQKGYVYTGSEIKPSITELKIDKTTYSFPGGISESSNFVVKYNNNVKVGNATATITLKRNATLSENQAYPYGGSVTVKYKIVPHKNTNLVLEK